MAFDAHKNFGYTTVSVAPTPPSTGTTLTVTDGTVFPTAPFNVTIWPAGALPLTTNAEIARCTNVAGNVLTIVRATATESPASASRSIQVGDQIANTITAKALTDIESLATSASNLVPGVSTITTTGSQTTLAIPSGTGNLVIFSNNAATLTIQGITPGVTGQRLTIFAMGGGDVVVSHQDGAAPAANRIQCAGAVTITMKSGFVNTTLIYDGTASYWRMIAATPISSTLTRSIQSKVANYTASITDDLILCNGTFTVTLYPAANNLGRRLDVKNIGSGTITIDANAAETIDGALTATLSIQYQSYTLLCDGSNWSII